MALLLAAGAANPPYAGPEHWNVNTINDWNVETARSDWRYWRAPRELPAVPWTLELSANHLGHPGSAWGFWLAQRNQRWSFLVNNEGYLFFGSSDEPRWAEFIHVRRGGMNRLYLDVNDDGSATLRINDEIAWVGKLDVGHIWGVVEFREPQLSSWSLRLFAPG